jgi:hypothetical protein
VPPAAACCRRLFVAALVWAACAPEPSLPLVRFAGIETVGDSLLVELRLVNPNRQWFELSRLGYAAVIAGETLASGRREAAVAVRGGDSTVARFPLRVDYARAFASIGRLWADSLELRLDGEYRVPGLVCARRGRLAVTRRFGLGAELRRLLGFGGRE